MSKTWRHNFTDFFLGPSQYSEVELETGRTIETLPEGDYDASYRLFKSVWKRPRWPLSTHLVKVDIKLDAPIVLSGQGGPSWQLNDDAWFSMVCIADTAIQAADYLAKLILHRRKLSTTRDG